MLYKGRCDILLAEDMYPDIKKTVVILLIGFSILAVGTLFACYMNGSFNKRQIFIEDIERHNDAGAIADGLNGTWEAIEVGDASQILSRYNVSVNEYNGTVYFARAAVAIGKGDHYNQTIQVYTYQGWSKFGGLLISIVNNTEMRAVPETGAVKWVLFVKS
jgi:hypothetical protein